ncbi:MAG: N-acetylglucosamine-6-phosphate deacetylase [Chloroflexota bacterium]|nr:N-acetylglucosamine-6-phosphate deacetylase [Chloroflexota bacterium]
MSRFAIRGRILLGTRLTQGMMRIQDGKIAEIQTGNQSMGSWEAIEMRDAAYIAPGFIDLQVNGGFGVEVGEDPEAIRALAAHLPETGVTAFLPTVITSPPEFYPKVIAAFEAARDAPGARPLGLHLEGPFLSPERHGAHRRDLIQQADPRLLDALLESDAVRLMTLAPERSDAPERIRKLREHNVVVSLGHTDATYEQFEAGAAAGARMATHLYNAMSPFAHRAPGAIGAALLDDRITVGLIADGVHSHPASLQLAFQMKHASRIALVTDMMAAAGMPPGTYTLGGQAVRVDGTSARLADGTLAGSLLTMDQAVRNILEWVRINLADSLRMASETPARLLGLTNVGAIREGMDADLVLLDRDIRVQATIIRGDVVYERGTQ